MATMKRVRVTLTGFPGGPGVATYHLSEDAVAADLTAIRTFWNTIVAMLPNTMTVTVPGSGDEIDDATGDLVGGWTMAAPAPVAGTSASGYAAPVGAVVNWQTGGIVNGRRVRGKTFVVPAVNIFEPGGTIVTASLGVLVGAAAAQVATHGDNLLVWSRPWEPGPGEEGEARDGSSHVVTAGSVPDKAIVLRSRRD